MNGKIGYSQHRTVNADEALINRIIADKESIFIDQLTSNVPELIHVAIIMLS